MSAGTDIVLKGAIPYSVHGDGPKAAESAEWNAAEEMKAADVDDLKVMAAWVDSENKDNKTAYKLLHHKADGKHPVVWRAVAAAMAALFGARGGVDIPSGDRNGVYNHLARHYEQFEKPVPEFKALEDLRTEFDSAIVELSQVEKPYVTEHSCRLRDPDDFQKEPWGRKTREHDGKEYDIIFGRLKGETSATEQAYRYPTDEWSESEARKHCKDHDGTFEPAKKQAQKDLSYMTFGFSQSLENLPEDFRTPMRRIVQSLAKETDGGFSEADSNKYNTFVQVNITVTQKPPGEIAESKALGKSEEHQATIIKVDDEQRLVWAIALEPDREDAQGDSYSADEVRKACHRFMTKLYKGQTSWKMKNREGKLVSGKQRAGDMHRKWTHNIVIVECGTLIADMSLGDNILKEGTWIVCLFVPDNDLWRLVKEGKRNGVSIMGHAVPEPVE